jgi:Purple acid Phosphatase, N-terminal domain
VYCFRVVSGDGSGQGWTVPLVTSGALAFQTTPVDPNAAKNYRIDLEGSKNIYAGSAIYIVPTPVLMGGKDDDWAELGIPVLKNQAGTVIPSSTVPYYFNCDLTIYYPDGQGTWSDGHGGQACYRMLYNPYLKLETPANLPPGIYTVTNAFSQTGILFPYTWTFNVLPPPTAPHKTPIPSVPPMDPTALARWQTRMTTDGLTFCVPGEFMSFGYEGQIWYYDGGRSYLQIGDYTGNKTQWFPCAENILNQMADRNIPSGMRGYEMTPHGLAMAYWRFGDQHAKAALNNMFGTPSGHWQLIRETAYAIDAGVKKAQVNNTPLDGRTLQDLDWGLADFDQLFRSNQNQLNQPFYDGIMAEALIDYYEYTVTQGTPDYRIPPAIKQMMDWLWNNAVVTNPSDPLYGHTEYTTLGFHGYTLEPHGVTTVLRLGAIYSNLNDLFSPAWAWYWNLTGQSKYQQQGDVLFNHALDDDASGIYNGKQFNQHYKWSFDYLHYRSSATSVLSLTDPSNNPPDASYVYNTTPPVISNIQPTNITGGSAIVTWTTDENASTWLQYGTLANTYTTYIPSVNGPNDSGSVMVQSHTLNIPSLAPGTTYHYVVMSRDILGNNTISADQTFTTTP